MEVATLQLQWSRSAKFDVPKRVLFFKMLFQSTKPQISSSKFNNSNSAFLGRVVLAPEIKNCRARTAGIYCHIKITKTCDCVYLYMCVKIKSLYIHYDMIEKYANKRPMHIHIQIYIYICVCMYVQYTCVNLHVNKQNDTWWTCANMCIMINTFA